jgi:BON domain
MSEKADTGLLAGTEGVTFFSRRTMVRMRWGLAMLGLGLGIGMWLGGGPDRYGEAEGVMGSLRGASRSIAKGARYASATLFDLAFQQRSSVRNLGLAQQLETRLWQDKRLVAEGIVVEVEAEGTAVLKGIVPDRDHKELAVALAQETRGVARVVDQLAVSPASRTIETTPADPVPTGVASGVVVRK